MYITTEPYKFEGYWSFSKDQSCWFSGVLEYSPQSHKIELSMGGSGEEINIAFHTVTSIGITSQNKKIPLLNAMAIHIPDQHTLESRANSANAKSFLHVVEANRILIGEHYNNINDISYSSLSIIYSDQLDFIQTAGFECDHSQGSYSITYNEPNEIVLLKTHTIEIKICFFGNFGDFRRITNESSIVQEEYFYITFPESHDLNFLREEINMLKYFIAFSISKDIIPLQCSFADSEPERIYLLAGAFFKTKRNDSPDFLRRKKIIEIDDFQNIPDLYEKWRVLFSKKESAIYKFFSTINSDHYFLDEGFHHLVLAFEDYHRNSPGFPQTVTSSGKDVPLKTRIDSVFDKFQKQLSYLFKDLSEQERVIKLIRNSRDFLTHGGVVRKRESVKDPNSYFYLTDLLISMIALMILNDLGFSQSVIKEKIWHLPAYMSLVNTDWSVVK